MSENALQHALDELAALRGDSKWPSMPAIETAWERWIDETCLLLHNLRIGLERAEMDLVFADPDGKECGFRAIAELLVTGQQGIKSRLPKIAFPAGHYVSRDWLKAQVAASSEEDTAS